MDDRRILKENVMQKKTSLALKLCCFVLLATLVLPLLPLRVAYTMEETVWLKAIYGAPGASTPREWDFPYQDAFFLAPAQEYNHALAKASLGMALSAFRNKQLAQNEQDKTVRAYLEGAGFGEFQSRDFDKVPTADTISTLIGSKQVDGFTVLAVAVCGGGYGNEWLSNFTVGDEERHVGFNEAAQKVEARIRDYISAQGIQSPMKLWISGYSRAAAVSNLTAADMSDSGVFEAVYAYTFATPRTTKNPGEYNNIFNIIGKFDPVPLVPMPEWGYKRNGVDIYTPAQETDSDYAAKRANADAVSRELCGTPFFNNVEMNATLHAIMDYLLAILPDSEAYKDHMQAIMLSIWENRSISNLSAEIIRLMEEENLLNEEMKYQMKRLLDYLSLVTYNIAMEQVVGQGAAWNHQTTAVDNLAHEHSPDVYVCWMFSSDDPAQIFTASDSYAIISWISAEATATIFDTQGRFVFSIDGQGRMSYNTDNPEWAKTMQPVAERPLIYCAYQNGRTSVTLPRDGNYLIYLTATQQEEMYYFSTEYRIDAIRAETGDVVLINAAKDDAYIVLSLDDASAQGGAHIIGSMDDKISLEEDDIPYLPSLLLTFQNDGAFHPTFEQMAMIAGGVLMLIIVLLVWLIVHLVRRNKHNKRALEASAEAMRIQRASAEEGAANDSANL